MEYLLNSEDLKQSELQERSPCNWVGQKKKKKERIRTGPVSLGGSCERGAVPHPRP